MSNETPTINDQVAKKQSGGALGQVLSKVIGIVALSVARAICCFYTRVVGFSDS
ncbi:MAG: hypothetical protein ACXVDN_17300 [Ktedonobacteraceae bacterium]